MQSFRSYKAPKVTILKNIATTREHIWNYGGCPCMVVYSPVPYIFRKHFSRATFATETVCLYLQPIM